MANNKIVKKDWRSDFAIIGEALVNDYTYKLNQQSEKSSWTYNSMSLQIDAGEKFGRVGVSLMGGYSPERESVIFVHGKDEDGNDDFSDTFEIPWDNRFDDGLLETVGDLCFFTVGLEKTGAGKTYYKRFLSAYDAIEYIHEHLTDGTVVNVKGRLRYQKYNGNVTVNKDVQSIVLSSVDDPSKYHASFTQSVLLDKDSANIKELDKERGILPINARVLDYVKEIDGHEIKGQYPFYKTFDWEFDMGNPENVKKIYEKLLKVKKDVTQITFAGDFVESGATVNVTEDDITDDIKELLDMGLYTKEQAIAACATGGSRERRMVLRRPTTKMVGEDDNKAPVIQKFDERYTEDDLTFDFDEDESEPPFGKGASESDGSTGLDDDWLSAL